MTSTHARELKTNYGYSSSIIPAGIKVPAPKAIERNIDVLGVGALTDLKNYSAFIDTVVELKKTHPEISAVIVGGGPEEEALKLKIGALGLKENIVLAGIVRREEVLQYMNRSKVFLHCSEFESFGMACAEAIAMGMSVVSLNTGIAQQSERWKVINNLSEAAPSVNGLLKLDLDHDSINLYPIESVVEKYSELYSSLL